MRNRHQGADEGLPGGGVDDSHDAAGHADGDDRRDGRLPGDGQCPQRGDQHTVSRLGDDKQPAQADRSATVPPHGPNSSDGTPPAASTRPSSAAEPVSRRTSQPIAVCCTKVPLAEATWPAKYSRNGRERSARNVPRLTEAVARSPGAVPAGTPDAEGWPAPSSGSGAASGTILSPSRSIALRRFKRSGPSHASRAAILRGHELDGCVTRRAQYPDDPPTAGRPGRSAGRDSGRAARGRFRSQHVRQRLSLRDGHRCGPVDRDGAHQ
jgi:hypothetical protein